MISYISPPGSDRTNKLVSWGLLLHGTRENPVNLKPGILTPTPPGPEVTATQPGVSDKIEIDNFDGFLKLEWKSQKGGTAVISNQSCNNHEGPNQDFWKGGSYV